MTEYELNRPIFVVGMPRSGTTAFFEDFSSHPDLAWMSNYSRMFPGVPMVNGLRRIFDHKLLRLTGSKDQYGTKSILNKILPRPDEAYEFWNMYSHPNFSHCYLADSRASTDQIKATRIAVKKLVKWQGKNRFSAKITGPSRIKFLSSIFPDAIFLHIIRNGLAVVHSLLNVQFWQQGKGLEKPWWNNGLKEEYLDQWKNSDKDPGVLAAVQWKQIVEIAREEAKSLKGAQYHEIKYEEYILDRSTILNKLFTISDLPNFDLGRNLYNQSNDFNEKYRKDWNDDYINKLDAIMNSVNESQFWINAGL